MPQPAVLKTGRIIMGAQGQDKKAELSLAMMRVVRGWSGCDANIGTMFNILLAGQREAASEIFHTLRDRELRIAALNAVARVRLSDKLCSEISTYYEGWRKASKVRNAIAHDIWLYAEDFPNCLCTLEPALLAEAFREQFRDTLNSTLTDVPLNTLNHYLVGKRVIRYQASDFKNALAVIIQITKDGGVLCQRILEELAAREPELFLPRK